MEKSTVISKLLSKMHRRLISQFIAHKERAYHQINELERFKRRILEKEAASAWQSPVLEGIYTKSRHTKKPLLFYDCHSDTMINKAIKNSEPKQSKDDSETETILWERIHQLK